MLDTVGAELQVINRSENAITLKADDIVVLTPDQEKEASSAVFPINFDGLSKVLLYFFLSYLYNKITCLFYFDSASN